MVTYKTYNPTGHRIQHIEVKGEPLRMDHTYRVAGGGEQIFKNLKDRKWLRVRAHDVLREYIARSKEVSVETQASIIPI